MKERRPTDIYAGLNRAGCSLLSYPRLRPDAAACQRKPNLNMFFFSVALWLSATIHTSGSMMTFQDEDPDTGLPVVCNRCPPGSYLRASCTAKHRSECAQCPPGSYTELWNYVTKCLRCGACGHNKVVKKQCSPERDCECQCKDGYYLKEKYDMCVRHSECPPGHGVVSKGSPEQDTVCQVCPGGFYSERASAHHNCTAHTSCDAAGQRLVLKGSTWHDNVCTTCEEMKTRDGADYVREIIPNFFVYQNMIIKRLRRLVMKLPSRDGGTAQRENVSNLPRRDLYALINAWVDQATTEDLRQLPGKLTRVNAATAGEKLENKIKRIDHQLSQLCVTQDAEVSGGA
ncbi:tumor necrosis factor receptor superfamily member 6B [Polymixia lowei]